MKHGINAVSQAGFLGQLQQEPECLIGDAMFRVVEVDADGFCIQAFSPLRVVRKKLAEMQISDLRIM
jgi:hypothetical protein